MPSFETILKHARCWSEPRLRAAAELWPDPLTWAWFLGDRCKDLSRAECVERLSTAVAWLKAERVALFVPVREIWLARHADKPVLLAGMSELGEFMDMWEAGEREPMDLPAVNTMLGIGVEAVRDRGDGLGPALLAVAVASAMSDVPPLERDDDDDATDDAEADTQEEHG